MGIHQQYVDALRDLLAAADEVIANWEGGDLAAAVNYLEGEAEAARELVAEWDAEDDAITGATDANDMQFAVESVDYSAERLDHDWHTSDIARQCVEGWRVSERSDGYYAIEKDDEANVFESDIHAYAFVKQRAAQGSAMHAEAIAKHGDRLS